MREDAANTEVRVVSAQELLHKLRAEESEWILERLDSRTTADIAEGMPLSLVPDSPSETEAWALRADVALQRTLLGDAIDEAEVLMFVADEDARYVAVNAYACKVLGYSREELLSMTVPEIAVDPEASAVYEAMVAERGASGLTPIRCEDGRILLLRYRASPVTIAGLEFWASIGVIDTASESAPRERAAQTRREAHATRDEARAVRAQAKHQTQRAAKFLQRATRSADSV